LDERLIVIGWTLGIAAFFGLVGAGFGAIAGMMARSAGHAPGGPIGRRILGAVERAIREELPPQRAAALVGACDGASFLGAVGAVLGFLAGRGDWFSSTALLAVCGGVLMLAILAAQFGLLAYGLEWIGIQAVGVACFAAVAGVFVGAWLFGWVGVFIGGEVGALGGLLTGILGKRPKGGRRTPWNESDHQEHEP
jgi:hypothetical protein